MMKLQTAQYFITLKTTTSNLCPIASEDEKSPHTEQKLILGANSATLTHFRQEKSERVRYVCNPTTKAHGRVYASDAPHPNLYNGGR